MASVGFDMGPCKGTERFNFLPQFLHMGDQLSVGLGLPNSTGEVPGIRGIRSYHRFIFAALNEEPAKSSCKSTQFSRVV
jgi:hypothetical protein